MKEELKALRAQGGVELMKASAGSGKTFNLAREYIRLLLTPVEWEDGESRPDPRAYRHILAVTFTNKATAEMKNRIIDELDILASDPASSDYLDYLKEECRYSSDDDLRRDARAVLSNILNDYGAFHISTIDSFFQQTLRAFSREIGQVAEYQVELDRKSLVTEAADRVLDSLSEDDGGLLRWLSSSGIEQMENGQKFNLENIIGEFAKGYLSDEYKAKAEVLGLDEDKVFSEDNIKKLRAICRKVVKEYDDLFVATRKEMTDFFNPMMEVINGNLKKNLTAVAGMKLTGALSFPDLGTMRDCADGAKECFPAKNAKKVRASYGPGIGDEAAAMLRKFFALEDRRLTVRNTARILESQVVVFRAAGALKNEFAKLLKEKNVLSISDTNEILRDIIGGTEVPFIYEKLGVRLRHFLLDEFQDTSVIQWDNFMPILRESISQGCYNLVVGDVKQSIYRWRDTDWRIIDSRVEEDMPRVAQNPLDTNWRSAENIVEFNNDFYRELAFRMDQQLSVLEGVADGTISRIYSDVSQNVSKAIGVPGCVELSFCDGKEIASGVVEAVLDAYDGKEFSYKDIAVLVRSNREGGEAASALIAAGIPVVTNDSLRISSSETVRCLVARLYRYDNPAEETMSFYEGDFDPSTVDGGGSILALSEELLGGMDIDDGDSSYVLAFLDLVRDFEKKNGNSLGSFLKYWEEEGVLKSISSPDGSEAVTVITIHKAKGLAYPCVVLPFPRKGALMKSGDKHWESPDLEGTELECLPPSLYHVALSEKSQNDLFRGEMVKERRMQYIDTINTWYVATTRASQMMYLIAPTPSDTFRNALPAGAALDVAGEASAETLSGASAWPKFNSVSDALYAYASQGGGGFEAVDPRAAAAIEAPEAAAGENLEVFRIGELPHKWGKPEDPAADDAKAMAKAARKAKRAKHGVELKYVQCPKGSGRGRLCLSAKAREFFFPEEIDPSETYDCRKHGTLVHSILESVNVPSDLGPAIERAVFSGLIDGAEALELEKWLSEAIASVGDRGWFSVSGAVHRNERAIFDPATGAQTRPDRVVVGEDGSIRIIDYKTGAKSPGHLTQVRGYVDSYRRMGYTDVTGYVWYIGKEVVSV